jgi:hypothetical protein
MVSSKSILAGWVLFLAWSRLSADQVSGDFQYQDNGAAITVTRYTGNGEAVAIPATIDGKTVSSIGSYMFSNSSGITSVEIPVGVTSIGDYAFAGCGGVTQISIPDRVVSIGEHAFFNCGLTSIAIPPGVSRIGNGAFSGCSHLTEIDVDADNAAYTSQAGVLFNKSLTALVEYPAGGTQTAYAVPAGVTTIRAHAFANCDNLAGITLPSSVTSIGSYAFVNCTGLTSITLPVGVTSINDHQFTGCSSLTSVTLPNGITSIKSGAFDACRSLARITIPASVASIESPTFYDCTSLAEIDVDPANPAFCSLDGVLFNKARTTLVAYPCGKTQTSYNIPDGVTTIGDNAFFGCEALASIGIPSGVAVIGASAFFGCRNLIDISLPASITSIESGAFGSCEGLTKITFPAGVASIGDLAFDGCSRLATACFQGAAPKSIGNRVFAFTALGFAVYYPEHAAGFTNPWHGYRTLSYAEPSRPAPAVAAQAAPTLRFFILRHDAAIPENLSSLKLFKALHPGVGASVLDVDSLVAVRIATTRAATRTYDAEEDNPAEWLKEGSPAVAIELPSGVGEKLGRITEANLGRRLVVALGDRILICPYISAPIHATSLHISLGEGSTAEQAQQIVDALRPLVTKLSTSSL